MRATSIQSNAGLIQAPAIHLAENTFIDLLGDQEIPTTVERAAGIHGEGGLRKSQASGRGVRTVAVIGEKNTYTGGTFIEAGTLRLAKATIPAKDIPNPPETEYAGCLGPGPLRVSAGAAFDLDGQEQNVASLHGEGEILLNGGTLVVADPDASDFSGAVRGPGRLVEGTAERQIQ